MSEFEIYTDANGQYRWRLTAGNGEILADSGEGYHNKADCENGLQNFRSLLSGAASQHTIERYADDGGEYRWRLRHQNGNIIADSGEGYSGRYERDRGLLTAIYEATDPRTAIVESE